MIYAYLWVKPVDCVHACRGSNLREEQDISIDSCTHSLNALILMVEKRLNNRLAKSWVVISHLPRRHTPPKHVEPSTNRVLLLRGAQVLFTTFSWQHTRHSLSLRGSQKHWVIFCCSQRLKQTSRSVGELTGAELHGKLGDGYKFNNHTINNWGVIINVAVSLLTIYCLGYASLHHWCQHDPNIKYASLQNTSSSFGTEDYVLNIHKTILYPLKWFCVCTTEATILLASFTALGRTSLSEVRPGIDATILNEKRPFIKRL